MPIRLMRLGLNVYRNETKLSYDGNELGYCESGIVVVRVSISGKTRGSFKILKSRKDGGSYRHLA